MDLFDNDGKFLGEAKGIFDSEGNLIGHFLENAKDKVESVSEDSWILGLFCLLIIAPGWTILGILLFLIIKVIRLMFWFLRLVFRLLLVILVTVLRCVWWLVRLPFCLIFRHEFPEF